MAARLKPNGQIVQEAAEWAEELDDGNLSAEQRQALADWLLKSPDHVNGLLLGATLFRAFGEIQYSEEVTIDDLLAKTAPELIPLLHASPAEERLSDDEDRGGKPAALASLLGVWRLPSSIAAGLAIFAMIGAGVFLIVPDRLAVEDDAMAYATVTGEQRSVPLDDRSVVHLNTESEIRIRFENGERNIDLLSGEAMFQVAHDPDRPFRVHAGDTIAEAIGTTFNVYRRDGETSVAVIEGKVAIETIDDAPILDGLAGLVTDEGDQVAESVREARLTLTAGERVAVHQGGRFETGRVANMETVTSWRLRKLVFERETLDAIVREYNRYGKLQIYIDDPVLAETRFTGVFAADDPESLLSFLELAGGIRAIRRSPVEVRLQTAQRRDG